MSAVDRPRSVAVILAGAVAQGAFEAGVLQVLADSGIAVRRIVAASSGALNGAYYAAAVRARREPDGARELAELWRDRGSWGDIFHVSLGDLLRGEGLSDHARLERLLREAIRPCAAPAAERAPIELDIIVASLAGVPGQVGGAPATTCEQMLAFQDADFDAPEALERVFNAAIASASFPLLFAPTEVPGLGPCVDGGAVNNAPIRYALDGEIGRAIDAIVVVSPTVAAAPSSPEEPHGLALVGRLAEMLINERLYRDLRAHEARNQALAQLAQLSPAIVNAEQLEAVKRAIGWQGARLVEAVTVRPDEPLPGNAFSGFYHAELRERYVEIGIARAQQVLAARGWA